MNQSVPKRRRQDDDEAGPSGPIYANKHTRPNNAEPVPDALKVPSTKSIYVHAKIREAMQKYEKDLAIANPNKAANAKGKRSSVPYPAENENRENNDGEAEAPRVRRSVNVLAGVKRRTATWKVSLQRRKDGTKILNTENADAIFNIPGIKKLKVIMDAFKRLDAHDKGRWKRSPQQIDMSNNMVASQMFGVIANAEETARLFNNDVNRAIPLVMKLLRVETIKRVTLIMTPRQFGKSTVMAMTTAVMLMSAPVYNAVICSTGQRISSRMANTINAFCDILLEFPANSHLKKMKSEERVKVWDPRNLKDERAVYALPGSSDKIRGIAPDNILIDEIAYVDQNAFKNVLQPLLSVENRSLIAISTPGPDGNEYTEMMNRKETVVDSEGKKIVRNLYNCLSYQLVCDKCRERRNMLCYTNMKYLPRWKPWALHVDTVEQMAMRDVGAVWRELIGCPEESTTNFISHSLLENITEMDPKAMDKVLRTGNKEVDTVYIAIDPATGGNCEFAIVSGFYDTCARMNLIAIDSALVRDLQTDRGHLLESHLRKIRQNRLFVYSRIVVLVEGNAQDSADVIMSAMRAAHVTVMKELVREYGSKARYSALTFAQKEHADGALTTGLPTLSDNKMQMGIKTKAMIFQHKLKYHPCLTTSSPTLKAPGAALNTLKNQLGHMTVKKEGATAKHWGRKEKAGLTGKDFGNDDLAMACFILCFYSMTDYWGRGNRMHPAGEGVGDLISKKAEFEPFDDLASSLKGAGVM